MAFTGMPNVPTSNVSEESFRMFAAIKQNLEELTGQANAEFAAVLRGSINVSYVGNLQSSQPNVTGRGYNLAGAGSVPDYNDFIAVVGTVQALVNDVQAIRDRLDVLISQLGVNQ